MHHRDQHRDGVLRLEAQRDVGRDHDQRRDDRDDRRVRDGLTERRADRGRARRVGEVELALERGAHLVDLVRPEVVRRDLERARALRVLQAGDLLDLRVAETLAGEHVADVVLVDVLLELDVDPRAGLEVDAEVDALGAERQRADEQDQARGAEEPLRVAHVVQPQAVALRLARAERRRLGEQPRLAHRAEDRLRREDRGEERDDDAEAEREREALDPSRREDEEDERDHDRHDVRVDDRRQALLVARRDAGGDRSAAADLLLDALEDHDVRVGGHPQRQDQAGDAGQREDDRDRLDQREEVDAVDRQRDDGDDAEDAVEDQQEQRDDDEARDARGEALVERLAAERRGHLRARDELELDRQRAGLQDVRELLRGLDREAALDLRAGAPVDAVGVAAEVDERRRDELVVEHDREVLVDLIGRLAGQDADARRCRAGRSAA